MKDETQGIESPLIQIPVEERGSHEIKAVLHPNRYIDVDGNCYPVFRFVRGDGVWTHIHPCLDKMLNPFDRRILTVFNHDVISGFFNNGDTFYLVKLAPKGYWMLMREEELLARNLRMGGIWDFNVNNDFNKVFREMMEKVKTESTSVQYVEGFVRPSIIYQFKNGLQVDLFDSETIDRLNSISNSSFNYTLFSQMDSFLNSLETVSEVNRPFHDLIDVTAIGEGIEVVKDVLMDSSPYLHVHVSQPNITYVKLRENCYRVAVRQDTTVNKYEYRLFELKSERDLDIFFNIYKFLAEYQVTKQ